ncbi:alpha/beta hydrolase family esterase [Chitinimonas lacunae]|uniref:Alpha/beta hydrolase family esterase n=1 Tax=Chitinimonas lacunae TaxID=1963018 RepID=A0ABV8MRI3_9NEIS
MSRSLVRTVIVSTVWLGAQAAELAAPASLSLPRPARLPELGPGDHEISLVHQNVTHRFQVHVPRRVGQTSPAPLLLSFHGGGGTAAAGEAVTQLIPFSDSKGFVLVEPEGYDIANTGVRTWNAGACCGPAVTRQIDHVGATAAFLDLIQRKLMIDPKRIYATGHSNGGMLAYRLACELSDRIAAIAPNAAFLMNQDLAQNPPRTLFACQPKRPVPVFHMHGLSDACAPFNGGVGHTDPSIRPPVSYGINLFRQLNRTSPASTISYQRGATTCETWTGLTGADVTLCTSAEAGHVWPGSDLYRWETRQNCGGNKTEDLDANSALWSFMLAHPLP